MINKWCISVVLDDNAETYILAVQSHHPPEEEQHTQEMQNGHEEYDQQQTQDLSGYGILPEHGLCARAVYDYQACKYGVTIIKLLWFHQYSLNTNFRGFRC